MNLKEFVAAIIDSRQDKADDASVQLALEEGNDHTYPSLKVTAYYPNGSVAFEYRHGLVFTGGGNAYSSGSFAGGNDRVNRAAPQMTNLVESLLNDPGTNRASLLREFDFMMGSALQYCRKYMTKDELRFYPRITLKKIAQGTLWMDYDERRRMYVMGYNPEFMLFRLFPQFVTSYASSGGFRNRCALTIPDLVGIKEPMDVLWASIAFVLKHEMGHIFFQHVDRASQTVSQSKNDIDNHTLANIVEDSYINNHIISSWVKKTHGVKRNINLQMGGITDMFPVDGAPCDVFLEYLRHISENVSDGDGVRLDLFDRYIANRVDYAKALIRQTGYYGEGQWGYCYSPPLAQLVRGFLDNPGKVALEIYPNAWITTMEHVSVGHRTPSSKRFIHTTKEIMSLFIDPSKPINYVLQDLGREKKVSSTRKLAPLSIGMLVRVRATTEIAQVLEVVQTDPMGNDTYRVGTVDTVSLKAIVDSLTAGLTPDQLGELRTRPNIPASLGLPAFPGTGKEVQEARKGLRPVALEIILPYKPQIEGGEQKDNEEQAGPKPKLSDILKEAGMTEEQIQAMADEMQQMAEQQAQEQAGVGGNGQDESQPPPPFENDLVSQPKDDTERYKGPEQDSPPSSNSDDDQDDSPSPDGGVPTQSPSQPEQQEPEEEQGPEDDDQQDGQDQNDQQDDEEGADENTPSKNAQLRVGMEVTLRSTGEKAVIRNIRDDGTVDVEVLV